MDSAPETSRGDVAYWGLTPTQAAHHHARLARMYADRSAAFADLAVGYARKAVVLRRVGIAFNALLFAVAVAWIVLAVMGRG